MVEHAEKIKVILQDRREFEAKIVGTDPKSDVAILEIKTDNRNVNMADTTPNETFPNTKVAWEPTPAAPTVCAMVFRVKIAAKGLFISSFNSRRILPAFCPLFSNVAIYTQETLNNTASAIEHKNEKNKAINK